jgi:hypothetical protein
LGGFFFAFLGDTFARTATGAIVSAGTIFYCALILLQVKFVKSKKKKRNRIKLTFPTLHFVQVQTPPLQQLQPGSQASQQDFYV